MRRRYGGMGGIVVCLIETLVVVACFVLAVLVIAGPALILAALAGLVAFMISGNLKVTLTFAVIGAIVGIAYVWRRLQEPVDF